MTETSNKTEAVRKRAAIIVNPISGGKDKKPVLEIIRQYFPATIDYDIIIWERPEQKDEIIRKIRERNYDIVVAAGGDGTINQVAHAIKETNSALAIIPLGSGNGFQMQTERWAFRQQPVSISNPFSIDLVPKATSRQHCLHR